MTEKHWLFFGYGLLAFAAGIYLTPPNSVTAHFIVTSLLVLCVLSGKLLAGLLSAKNPVLMTLCVLLCLLAGLFWGTGMLPLLSITIVQAATALGGRRFVPGAIVSVSLLALVLGASGAQIAGTAVLVIPLLFCLLTVDRLIRSQALAAHQSEEIEQLREQLENRRKNNYTLEQSARLAERNRLAVRIHDRIGHGVSGSILLLEGAMLQIDSEPGAAHKTVEKATENLRASVNDIRAALREERSSQSESGLAQLAAELSRFETEHGIRTALYTKGDTDTVTPEIWHCLYQNLLEAQTNLLKHSSAEEFTVSLENKNKLLCVTFQDDGRMTNKPKPDSGMGLRNMRERCAACGGRLFFNYNENNGFGIRMTFSRLSER